MAQQIINLGATGSGAGGDSARTAFEKAIANFAELYLQKADLASPVFTGNPTAPTPASTDNDTSIATTAFVRAAMGLFGLGAERVYSGDLNGLITPGLYSVTAGSTNWPFGQSGGTLIVLMHEGGDYASQLALSVTDNRVLKRAKVGASWSEWQEIWHSGNLVKQASANDFTPSSMARVDTVRRHLGYPGAIHTRRLVLLHPLYTDTLLPLHLVEGRLTFVRGGTSAITQLVSANVCSSAAYNTYATQVHHTGNTASTASPFSPVSCTYGGVKYAALLIPFSVQGYGGGAFFEGQVLSDDINALRVIDYFDQSSNTVLNSEVNGSIQPLGSPTTFFVGGKQLVERGSNANGEYVRFADGTQVCTFSSTGALSVSAVAGITGLNKAQIRWNFPATFYNTYTLSLSGCGADNSQNGWVGGGTSVSTSYADMQYFTPNGSVTSTAIRFMAIGRWY